MDGLSSPAILMAELSLLQRIETVKNKRNEMLVQYMLEQEQGMREFFV